MIDQTSIIYMIMDFSKVRGQAPKAGVEINCCISEEISMSIRSSDDDSYDTTFAPPGMRRASTDLVKVLPYLENVNHREGYVREYRHRCTRELIRDTGFDEDDIDSTEFQTLLKIRYPDIS